jgi:hypothetical protein
MPDLLLVGNFRYADVEQLASSSGFGKSIAIRPSLIRISSAASAIAGSRFGGERKVTPVGRY